jgi:hypothetical protein
MEEINVNEIRKAVMDTDKREVIEDIIGDKNSTICLSVVCNADLSWEQMEEIRQGFLHNLAYEQVAIYADLRFDWEQMDELRTMLEKDIEVEKVMFAADKEKNFTAEQMTMIRLGAEANLSLEELKVIGNPELETNQMFEIMMGMRQGLTKEEVSAYQDKNISAQNMKKMRKQLVESTKSNKLFYHIQKGR